MDQHSVSSSSTSSANIGILTGHSKKLNRTNYEVGYDEQSIEVDLPRYNDTASFVSPRPIVPRNHCIIRPPRWNKCLTQADLFAFTNYRYTEYVSDDEDQEDAEERSNGERHSLPSIEQVFVERYFAHHNSNHASINVDPAAHETDDHDGMCGDVPTDKDIVNTTTSTKVTILADISGLETDCKSNCPHENYGKNDNASSITMLSLPHVLRYDPNDRQYRKRFIVQSILFAAFVLALTMSGIYLMTLGPRKMTSSASTSEGQKSSSNLSNIFNGINFTIIEPGCHYIGNSSCVGSGKLTMTSDDINERKYILRTLLSVRWGISDHTQLDTVGTVQNMALDWIVTNYLSTNSNNHLLEQAQVHDLSIRQLCDLYVMTMLYYAWNGNEWINNCSFLSKPTNVSSSNVCTWNSLSPKCGVTCNENNLVTHIILPSNNLHGQLPSEMQHLQSLEHLSLFNNSISGTLPTWIPSLSQVTFIQLQRNQIYGYIPDVWTYEKTNIQYLGLSHNQLIGSIPNGLISLKYLKEIDLSFNQLTSGLELFDNKGVYGDSNIQSMCTSNLKLINLSNNLLHGELSDSSFKECTDLDVLDLSNNGKSLIGSIPEHFYNVRVVNLDHNSISGTIPNISGWLHRIEYLSLHGNSINGTIPVSFGLLSKLTFLDLSSNLLSGRITDAFDNFNTLHYMYLANNTNFIPERIPYLYDALNLRHISFSNTNRIGLIPFWLNNLSNLKVLDLHSNNLSGSIPYQVGVLQNVTHLLLHDNLLNDTVPSSFNVSDAAVITFDNNELVGSLDELFCSSAEFQRHVFSTLTADCEDTDFSQAEISCTCCTTCCARQIITDGQSNELCSPTKSQINKELYDLKVAVQQSFIQGESFLYVENVIL